MEFIQNVINRMARNSFMLKSLMALQVAAAVAFQAKGGSAASDSDISENSVLVAVIPFWYLDSYFLRQERLFRKLYEHVRELNEGDIDFSMKVSVFSKNRVKEFLASIFSETLPPYYLVVASILLGMIYLVD